MTDRAPASDRDRSGYLDAFNPRRVARTYDAVAEEYAATFGDDLDQLAFDRDFLGRFLALLPQQGRVIDAGCGPGVDAARSLADGRHGPGRCVARVVHALSRV